MCHELWGWRERRRSESLDEELRYLLDEEPERSKREAPVVEHSRDEQEEPERLVVEGRR